MMTFLNTLLQITTTPSASDSIVKTATEVAAPQETISLFDLLMKGGWVMVPIFVLSFIALYIMIERYIVIKRASKDMNNFMTKIKSLIVQGDIKAAKSLSEQTDSPVARMIEKGIMRL